MYLLGTRGNQVKMMRATLHSGWSHVEPFIDAYGGVAIFFMIYLESVGAPLPGETGMIAASLLAAQQKHRYLPEP